MVKKSPENNDVENKGANDAGSDPSAPITRRGVLTSFLSGKPMEIPEQDVVSFLFTVFHFLQNFFHRFLHFFPFFL